jgi:hypothetical protein
MSDGSTNVVIRRPNPGKGQGLTQAISARTGWEYEHDETDEQIDAIEGLIAQHRAQPGHEEDTFSWTSSTGDGEGVIRIGTTYHEPGDGVVNLGNGQLLEGRVWVTETWEIDPDGTVRAAE